MVPEEVLSQDEVDALLTGVAKGEVSVNSDSENSQECKTLDFENQEKIVRSQFPVVGRIHERFAKKMSEAIYDMYSREVKIDNQELQIINFGEFVRTLKMPTSINSVRFHPLRGKGIIILDSQLVYTLVENYFGGNGKIKSIIEEREFTLTEQHIISIMLGLIFECIKEAWSPVYSLNLELIGSEMNPQLTTISSSTDLMLISQFEIKFEENSGSLFIVMPYNMLEPIRDSLDFGSTRSDDEIDPNWVKALRHELLDVPLEINSILTETTLSLKEVREMKEGDIIPVELSDEVMVYVGGIPSFKAKYGISKDKCALKIQHKVKR